MIILLFFPIQVTNAYLCFLGGEWEYRYLGHGPLQSRSTASLM